MDERPTVSAAEFSRLTGIDRERLRTWERRHGFPEPIRAGAGARRYAVEEVETAISVRRAIDEGTPVAVAIAHARTAGSSAPDVAALAGALDAAPLPTLLLTGPEPATVVYANRAARNDLDAPKAGTALAAAVSAHLAPAFAAREPVRLTRRSWREGGVGVACVAVPLAPTTGRALLALYDLEPHDSVATREQAAALAGELDRVHERLAERESALDLAVAVSESLRDAAGVEAILASVEALLKRLHVADAALAPYMSGQVVLGRSSRGMLGPDMLTVAGEPQLAHAVRTGEITALAPPEAAALGVPEGLGALLVPARCAGEPLAVLILVTEGEPHLETGMLRVLALVGTALGLALMQERLLTGEPGAGR